MNDNKQPKQNIPLPQNEIKKECYTVMSISNSPRPLIELIKELIKNNI